LGHWNLEIEFFSGNSGLMIIFFLTLSLTLTLSLLEFAVWDLRLKKDGSTKKGLMNQTPAISLNGRDRP